MRGFPKQQTTTGRLGQLSRFLTVGTPTADRPSDVLRLSARCRSARKQSKLRSQVRDNCPEAHCPGVQCPDFNSDGVMTTYPTGSKMMIRPILAALTVACLSSTALAESCVASRYGGGRTASGERMNASAMTAAHRSRPFGSYVTVTSHSNGRSVTVRINDRGPFVRGRCIDLSNGAARVIGMSGIGRVSLR
jgi:rare lipoprotein A